MLSDTSLPATFKSCSMLDAVQSCSLSFSVQASRTVEAAPLICRNACAQSSRPFLCRRLQQRHRSTHCTSILRVYHSCAVSHVQRDRQTSYIGLETLPNCSCRKRICPGVSLSSRTSPLCLYLWRYRKRFHLHLPTLQHRDAKHLKLGLLLPSKSLVVALKTFL